MVLAFAKDFHLFERLGMIMQPEDKDAALLPRREVRESLFWLAADACVEL